MTDHERSAGRCSGIMLVLILFAATGAAAEKRLPRYQFEVGQRLSYTGSRELGNDAQTRHRDTETELWVTRQNSDGSWRIVACQEEGPWSDSVASGKRGAHVEPIITIAYFDLFPNGQIVIDPTMATRLDPKRLLPPLPSTIEEMQDGWTTHYPVTGETAVARPLEDSEKEGLWQFELVWSSPTDKIYLGTSKAVYRFDPQRQLIVGISNEATQGWNINGKASGKAELESVSQTNSTVLEQFVVAANAYFDRYAEYRELREKARRQPNIKRGRELLAKSREVLQHATDSVGVEQFRQDLEDQLAQHDRMTGHYLKTLRKYAASVGMQSPDWEAEDLEGNTHTMKAYRGNVVILDFWYRGCVWCIRAMPQIKELAEQWKDHSVVVLGMNTDRKEENVQFVAKTMNLNYPNLRAEGIPEKYDFPGFPSLIIVDQRGNIHDMLVGWSPTLREDVSTSIQELLEEQDE